MELEKEVIYTIRLGRVELKNIFWVIKEHLQNYFEEEGEFDLYSYRTMKELYNKWSIIENGTSDFSDITKIMDEVEKLAEKAKKTEC